MSTQCNLIIDSCCDLPFDVVNVEGVDVISFPYIVNEVQHDDDMYRSITPHDFYEGMRKGDTPSTAQLSMQTLDSAFRRALESGVPTVFLSFSSQLSGSYDSACLTLERLQPEYPQGELHVVDTKLASVAEGLLVYEAICQRDKGLTAKQMAQWAEEARYFVNCLFMVDDLDALQRGGRIPSSVAMAGAKLDVKPLLNFDLSGKLTLSGVARGRKKGIRQLGDYIMKHVDTQAAQRTAVIAHSDCPKDSERLMDIISKQDPNVLFLESFIGPTIGSHVGPGMLAVVFWGPDRREEISVADRIANRIKKD